MPRNTDKRNESTEQILQDFSVTSMSQLQPGEYPCDSSQLEEIAGCEKSLSDISTVCTADLNIFSGPYPADSTIEDITKTKSTSPKFKKPLKYRCKKKPRPSLFDSDLKDSEPDTPDTKPHRPFQRKARQKNTDPNLFDSIFHSSSENLDVSNIPSNFITRRKLRASKVHKSVVFNDVFDDSLNDLTRDVSVSSHQPFKNVLLKQKTVNPDLFKSDLNSSDSLQQSNNGSSKIKLPQQLPLRSIRRKQKSVDTGMFNSDLDTPDSFMESQVGKQNSSYFLLGGGCSSKKTVQRLPFKILRGKPKKINSEMFEDDLDSSHSFLQSQPEKRQSSHSIQTNGKKDNITPQKLPFAKVTRTKKGIDEGMFDSDLNSSSSFEQSQTKPVKPNHEKIGNISLQQLPFRSSKRKEKSVDQRMFDSDLNSSKSFHNSETGMKKISINKATSDECNPEGSKRKKKYIDHGMFDSDLNSSNSVTNSQTDVKKSITETLSDQCSPKNEQMSELRYFSENESNLDRTSDKSSSSINMIENPENLSSIRSDLCSTKQSNSLLNSDKEETISYSASEEEYQSENEFKVDDNTLTEIEGKDADSCYISNDKSFENSNNLLHYSCDITLVEENYGSSDDKSKIIHTVEDHQSKNINELFQNSSERENVKEKSNSSETTVNQMNANSFMNVESDNLKVHCPGNGIAVEKPSNLETEYNGRVSAARDYEVDGTLHTEEIISKVSLLNEELVKNNITCSLGNQSSELDLTNYQIKDKPMVCLDDENIKTPKIVSNLKNSNLRGLNSCKKEKRVSFKLTNDSRQYCKKVNEEESVFSLESLVFEQTCDNSSSGSVVIELNASKRSKSSSGSINYELNSSRSQMISKSTRELNSSDTNQDKSLDKITFKKSGSEETKTVLTKQMEEDEYINGKKITLEKQDNEDIDEENRMEENFSAGNEEYESVEGENESLDRNKSVEEDFTHEKNESFGVEYEHVEDEESEHFENEENESVEDKEDDSVEYEENESVKDEESDSEQVEEDESVDEEDNENAEEEEDESIEEEDDINEEGDQNEQDHETASRTSTQQNMSDLDLNHSQLSRSGDDIYSDPNTSINNFDIEKAVTQGEQFGQTPNPDVSRKTRQFESIKQGKKYNLRNANMFKHPLPPPPNKRKVQEILDKIPWSELKKKKRRSSIKNISRVQMEQNEIDDALRKRQKQNSLFPKTATSKLRKPKKWVSTKLYDFIISKLQPQFGIKSRVRAESVVLFLVERVENIMRNGDVGEIVTEMKYELASLKIIQTHWNFYEFVTGFFDGYFVDKVFPKRVGEQAFKPLTNSPFSSIL